MPRFRATLMLKGLLLVSLPLIFTIILVALLFRVQREFSEAAWWQNHTKEVIRLAERARSRMTAAHSESRAYAIIPDDPQFEQEAAADAKAAGQLIEDLFGFVSDSSEQQQQVRVIQEKYRALDRWLAEQREAVRRGDAASAILQIRNRNGVQLSDEFYEELARFVRVEEENDQERTARLAQVRNLQRITLIAGTALTIAVSGVALLTFGRSIARRVGIVTENASRLAENRPLLTRVGGTDEIALLDAAMHATSDRLGQAARDAERYKHELERRAEDLARANESLRQQTQENEMFVYSVSHDLRSPLVNLQGFSKELEHASEELRGLMTDDRIPPEIGTRVAEVIQYDVKDSVKFIQTAVSRSAAIIDALLRLSRAGRVEYRPQRVEVGAIVQRVVDAMRGTITSKHATLTVHPLAPVWGDPTAIEQIFGNLIGNAVNYLDDSRPGIVEVGMLNDVAVDEAGQRTYFVRDNGLGIPEAHLNKVFVAFQRLHGDVAKGEGIGLALVRRIIDRHGGKAWVESTVGVGTTFFVSLPAEAPAAQPASQSDRIPASAATVRPGRAGDAGGSNTAAAGDAGPSGPGVAAQGEAPT